MLLVDIKFSDYIDRGLDEGRVLKLEFHSDGSIKEVLFMPEAEDVDE